MTKLQIQNLLRAQCPPWPAPLVLIKGVLRPVLGLFQGPFAAPHPNPPQQGGRELSPLEWDCCDGRVVLAVGSPIRDKKLLTVACQAIDNSKRGAASIIVSL